MILGDHLSEGDIVLLLLRKIAASGVRSLRLEFDHDYGIANRIGWSVSTNGSVRVEFASGPLEALALALGETHVEQEEG